jgi:hypothetical protein
MADDGAEARAMAGEGARIAEVRRWLPPLSLGLNGYPYHMGVETGGPDRECMLVRIKVWTYSYLSRRGTEKPKAR